jgi:hypothetical protein
MERESLPDELVGIGKTAHSEIGLPKPSLFIVEIEVVDGRWITHADAGMRARDDVVGDAGVDHGEDVVDSERLRVSGDFLCGRLSE